MKKSEIQQLASKIQLIITEEEWPIYLEIFQELERMLKSFRQVKIGKKVKSMTRINTGYLTLKDLARIQKKFSSLRIEKKTLCHNASTTPDNFILFKKNS